MQCEASLSLSLADTSPAPDRGTGVLDSNVGDPRGDDPSHISPNLTGASNQFHIGGRGEFRGLHLGRQRSVSSEQMIASGASGYLWSPDEGGGQRQHDYNTGHGSDGRIGDGVRSFLADEAVDTDTDLNPDMFHTCIGGSSGQPQDDLRVGTSRFGQEVPYRVRRDVDGDRDEARGVAGNRMTLKLGSVSIRLVDDTTRPLRNTRSPDQPTDRLSDCGGNIRAGNIPSGVDTHSLPKEGVGEDKEEEGGDTTGGNRSGNRAARALFEDNFEVEYEPQPGLRIVPVRELSFQVSDVLLTATIRKGKEAKCSLVVDHVALYDTIPEVASTSTLNEGTGTSPVPVQHNVTEEEKHLYDPDGAPALGPSSMAMQYSKEQRRCRVPILAFQPASVMDSSRTSSAQYPISTNANTDDRQHSLRNILPKKPDVFIEVTYPIQSPSTSFQSKSSSTPYAQHRHGHADKDYYSSLPIIECAIVLEPILAAVHWRSLMHWSKVLSSCVPSQSPDYTPSFINVTLTCPMVTVLCHTDPTLSSGAEGTLMRLHTALGLAATPRWSNPRWGSLSMEPYCIVARDKRGNTAALPGERIVSAGGESEEVEEREREREREEEKRWFQVPEGDDCCFITCPNHVNGLLQLRVPNIAMRYDNSSLGQASGTLPGGSECDTQNRTLPRRGGGINEGHRGYIPNHLTKSSTPIFDLSAEDFQVSVILAKSCTTSRDSLTPVSILTSSVDEGITHCTGGVEVDDKGSSSSVGDEYNYLRRGRGDERGGHPLTRDRGTKTLRIESRVLTFIRKGDTEVGERGTIQVQYGPRVHEKKTSAHIHDRSIGLASARQGVGGKTATGGRAPLGGVESELLVTLPTIELGKEYLF